MTLKDDPRTERIKNNVMAVSLYYGEIWNISSRKPVSHHSVSLEKKLIT